MLPKLGCLKWLVWVFGWAARQAQLTFCQPDSGSCLVRLQFHHKVLPADIQSHKVLLFDATVATGAAATMAIRVLKDHRVEEKNIILCTLLASKTGLWP